LRHPVSPDETDRAVDTMGYNFDVVVEKLSGITYF